jgi:hypothetical protein
MTIVDEKKKPYRCPTDTLDSGVKNVLAAVACLRLSKTVS